LCNVTVTALDGIIGTCLCSVVFLITWFPRPLESAGFFFLNSRTWKVLENHFGPGKS